MKPRLIKDILQNIVYKVQSSISPEYHSRTYEGKNPKITKFDLNEMKLEQGISKTLFIRLLAYRSNFQSSDNLFSSLAY